MATARILPEAQELPREPFHLSAAWARCWAEAYGEGRPLVLDLGGAILRLSRRKARLGPIRFSLLSSATNLQTCYFDLEGGGASREALAALPTRLLRTGAAQVRIDWLPENSALLAAARDWRPTHLALVEPFALSPIADCHRDFETFLADAGSSVAKYWKNCRRHILHGSLDFSIVRGGPGLGDLIDEMFALEASGWKGRDGTAIVSNPRDAAFYRGLAFAAAEAGALRIALLREEGRLIAFEYCVVGGDSVLAMKVGYDETRRRLQPGHMLALMNIRDACADASLSAYDMLGNGLRIAPYKARFATGARALYRIRLFARTPEGVLLYALYRAKPLAKRLRAFFRRRSDDAARLHKAGTGSRHEKT
jgi:CelD/BcsL family acetyltransferase involved in cellulose biosynthesis